MSAAGVTLILSRTCDPRTLSARLQQAEPSRSPRAASEFSANAQIFLRTLAALPTTSSPMTTENARLHTPAGIFVVHMRSDSDPSRQQLMGRIEHVMSGASEPFASLEGLLGFIGRYLSMH